MAQQEQAVADIFNSYMQEQCNVSESQYHYFSLGGQDRDTGADYLVSNSTDFALIEFKHSEAQLVDERHKKRREDLCLLLQKNDEMRGIHDRCHFIAWMDSKTGVLHCAPYIAEVCNKKVFPNCDGLTSKNPDKQKRIAAAKYASQFISPPPDRNVEKSEFEKYLAWLMKDASGSSKETVELMAKSPKDCAAIRFNSVDSAYQWMQGVPGFSPTRKKNRPKGNI